MASDFGSLLKLWRRRMKMSQLDLAVQCDISSKHISFLETGRSRPSRNMIMRLGEALAISHSDVSRALDCAGFEASNGVFSDHSTLSILARVLEKHEPYPVIVINQYVESEMIGEGMIRLLAALELDMSQLDNPSELLFSSQGFASHIVNVNEVVYPMLKLIKIKYNNHPDNPKLKKVVEHLRQNEKLNQAWLSDELMLSEDKAFFSIDLAYQGHLLRWKMVLFSLGTPRMITLNEYIMFQFFPDDAFTADFCREVLGR